MSDLFANHDGAHPVAQTVLAILRDRDRPAARWSRNHNPNTGKEPRPQVDRWYDGLHQGYVVHLRSQLGRKVIAIVFLNDAYDDVVARVYRREPERSSSDAPTRYEGMLELERKDEFAGPETCADWIHDRLARFWAIETE